MKVRFTPRLIGVICALSLAQSALAFYNPSTGRWLKGEMFWGHFTPGVHPSMSESEWFDFIRHWPGGGKPEWRDAVKYPLVGLERPTTQP